MLKRDGTPSSIDHVSDLLAVVTGAVDHTKGQHAALLGRVAQAALKGKFINQLNEEWQDLKSKGKITDHFEQSAAGTQCAFEMYRFLDNGEPYQECYDFVSGIFFRAATTDRDTANDWLPQELIRIAAQLGPMEIRVLTACFTRATDWKNRNSTSDGEWKGAVAEESHITVPELIDIARAKLAETRLLEKPLYPDGSGIGPGVKLGLTQLGYAICEHALASRSAG